MSKSEQAIFTNMCMVFDDSGRILVQDRVSKNWPGLTFPGGHIDKGESFTKSVIREVWEETGLTIKAPMLCGVKQFQTNEDERYVVLLYKTNQFEGKLSSSEEGEVFWIAREELTNYQLASDFEEMLKVFESDDLSEFYYYQENETLKLTLI
ncbi:MAG TPA: 8-oxo-dGTP diphosphatase [Bacilli bacterium]|nr:8-oxo-dGTP diphosphatase [Bacilli bacterium]